MNKDLFKLQFDNLISEIEFELRMQDIDYQQAYRKLKDEINRLIELPE